MTPESGKQIAITIRGRVAACTPMPQAIFDSLTFDELSYQHRCKRGRWTKSTMRLFNMDSNGSAMIFAGSVPRVKSELQALGYSVTVSDLRILPPAIGDYDHKHYEKLTAEQRRRADLILRNQQFILNTTQKGAFETMGQVSRLFSKARILIVLPTVTAAECDRVTMEMAEYVGPAIQRAVGLACECSQRVGIVSYAQFAVSHEGHWEIVLFPQAERAVTKQIADGSALYDKHRVYGFIGMHTPLSKSQILRLEALAGPFLDDCGILTAVPAVTAVFCTSRSRPLRIPSTPLERKRDGIWHNESRNVLIAQVAQAFASGDEEVLQSHFRVGDNPSTFTAGPRSVAILVESPEHGRELVKLLLEWSLRTGINRESNESPINGCSQSIITMMVADQSRHLIADVLVRADGGVNAVRPPVPLARFAGSSQSLIVDFLDEADEEFVAASQARALAYAARGYDVRCPEWLLQFDHDENRSRSQTKDTMSGSIVA